jgi:hypothetical protein
MGQNSCTCLKKTQRKSKLSTANPTIESVQSTTRNRPEASSILTNSKHFNENERNGGASSATLNISKNHQPEQKEAEEKELEHKSKTDRRQLVSIMKSGGGDEILLKENRDIESIKGNLEKDEQIRKADREKSDEMEEDEERKNDNEKELMKISVSRNIEAQFFHGLDGPKLEMIRAYPAGSVINKKPKASSNDNSHFSFANPFSSHQTYRYANMSDFQRVSASNHPSALSLQELPP